MNPKKVNHLAIIMDGNGRWARKRGLPRSKGHLAGTKAVKRIAKACMDLGIRYLSLYAFSTENWTRPRTEINSLMRLLAQFLRTERDTLHKNGIRLLVSGDITRLPRHLQKEINDTIELTKKGHKLILNIALNYGSRDEILRAVRRVSEDNKHGRIKVSRLNEKMFKKYLFHGSLIPDPDILIRTSGEMRISNFQLWQIAYTELFFTRTLWPDFNGSKLKKILHEYHNRHRRFGGL